MRKVINGKLYDTEKARKIAEWSDGYPRDFGYVSETLYRKRTGEYFIHGEGGPQSAYAQSCGQNSWMGGEKITPVSYESAKDWMERHCEADEYEAEFGTPAEGSEHDLHVIVSEAAWQALSRAAAQDGVTIGAIIERLASTL